jgi:hypothetical protein
MWQFHRRRGSPKRISEATPHGSRKEVRSSFNTYRFFLPMLVEKEALPPLFYRFFIFRIPSLQASLALAFSVSDQS